MGDKLGEGYISSKDIIDKTGISRATLNNYIKMGILPRPEVRRAGPDQGGAKKVGYFPSNVLDSINKVKSLKRQGYSIERIANEFRTAVVPNAPENNINPEPVVSLEPSGPVSQIESSEKKVVSGESRSKPTLTMTPGDFPAYLVNHGSGVSWIGLGAARLFGEDFFPDISPDSGLPNIFNLLLREEFRQAFSNWEEIVALHRSILAGDIIGNRTAIFHEFGTTNGVSSGRIPVSFRQADGKEHFFVLHLALFDQGILFTYIPSTKEENTVEKILRQRERILKKQFKLPVPAVIPCCVLVVNLDQAEKICAELPPEEYLELYNELRMASERIFDKYNGLFGGRTANGVFCYFVSQAETSYTMDAIGCALELRDMIKNVSRDWQARKKWGNTLLFNIAVNEGQEYLGMIRSQNNIELAALGKLVKQTGKLGDFAASGSILASKNVINGLSATERAKIRFGIPQDDLRGRGVIENSFARIIDLQGKKLVDEYADIAQLPVTEILALS